MARGAGRERGPSAGKAGLAAAVLVVAVSAWWFLTDGRTLLSEGRPQAEALREYIAAAQRRDCASVLAAVSSRTREAVQTALPGRPNLELMLCDYSPAPARLSNFETDRIRVEDVSGGVAQVSAAYTYERLFGFFPRGRDRHVYNLVLEDGRWRVDLAEHFAAATRARRVK
ncbi:MAG TPA: hypothetical protein VFZ31_12465 [Vicinamibacterales bacterium]